MVNKNKTMYAWPPGRILQDTFSFSQLAFVIACYIFDMEMLVSRAKCANELDIVFKLFVYGGKKGKGKINRLCSWYLFSIAV